MIIPENAHKGCRNVRVWSYFTGGISAVISLLATIIFTTTLVIYNREDIQADKSNEGLASTSIAIYITGLLIALWSLFSAILMIVGVKNERTSFVTPFYGWHILLFIVSIFGSIVQFVLDLMNKKGFGEATKNYMIGFTIGVVIFVISLPVAFYLKYLKEKREGQQKQLSEADEFSSTV